MRILLFDWTEGGHHEVYVRRFADLLSASADVYVAVSDGVARSVTDSGASILPLGPARPPTDLTRPRGPQHREWGQAEVRMFEWMVQVVRPDVAVHLYADPVLRWLVKRPVLPIRTVLCLFFPRAHYPKAYGSGLSASERVRAAFQEHLVRRWRRRPDAHALLTLDEHAARRWARRRGAPAHWLPEPPVDAPSDLPPPAGRAGCLLFGSLAARKGIDRLAAAVCTAPHGLTVTLAGASEPGFSGRLDEHVCSMRAAGADVVVLDRQVTPQEGADLLAHSRCAVLPYPRHNGMSRVLVEAAAARTPVVAENHGLVGHLVRSHGLGAAVDSADPVSLGGAIRGFTEHEHAVEAHEEALRRFAEHYAPQRFDRAVWGALHVTPNADQGRRSMLWPAGAGRHL